MFFKLILLVLVCGAWGEADDYDRAVSTKSGFEYNHDELKTEQNIEFVKKAAQAKALYGKRSTGSYTADGEQNVGSVILQNSKALNIYNYADIKGPVINNPDKK
ncbi:MAG: hypothetical protein JXK05_08170 [Campylobacterales bacterium]|nr:hypothetical protein [Campylobacterales bacterium]